MGVLYLDYLATRPRSNEFTELVGFVDDHRGAQGRQLRGFRILGSGEDLPRLIAERQVNQVVLAIDEDNLEEGFVARLRKGVEGLEVELKRWSCGMQPFLEDGRSLEKSEGISEGDRSGDLS